MEETPQKITYNDENFRKLMADIETLSTFEEIELWDRGAQAEVEKLLAVLRPLDVEIAKQIKTADHLKQTRSQKSFLERMFTNDNDEQEVRKLVAKYIHIKEALGEMATNLQERIDFTPNSPEDQKKLAVELKQRKKELQFEKREIAATLKATRAEARRQSAEAGVVSGFFGGSYYDPSTAAHERRNIRYAKEAALRPHESAKTAVERQLIQVDRDIIWVEKFGKK